MNNHLTFKGFIFLCLVFFTNITSATVFTAGDIVRVDFDLSAELPSPPYDGIYTSMSFDNTDLLDPAEGFTVALFDDGGENLNDGIGYYLLYDIIGSFDLTNAWAAGRLYDGGTVSTDYIEGVISTVNLLPDLDTALSMPYSYTNPHTQSVSWVGLDRHIVIPESVPEPTTLLLMSIGLLGLAFKIKQV